MKRDLEILQAVQEGETYEAVGARYGLTRQRVGQIVKDLDPSFQRPKRPKPEPEPRPDPEPRRCAACGRQISLKRLKHRAGWSIKYHDKCAEAIIALKRLTDYKDGERLRFARYCLRNPDKVPSAQRRWAMRVLRAKEPATGKRYLKRSSATYVKLKAAGLLGWLPEGIEIID